MQLAVLDPEIFDSIRAWSGESDIGAWITDRVEALREYSSFDERLLRRCECDAAFFHLYGIERDDVDYIMETFPIVKRKDIAEHGEYRTKRMILEIYDAMAAAERTGVPYESQFDEQANTNWRVRNGGYDRRRDRNVRSWSCGRSRRSVAN